MKAIWFEEYYECEADVQKYQICGERRRREQWGLDRQKTSRQKLQRKAMTETKATCLMN